VRTWRKGETDRQRHRNGKRKRDKEGGRERQNRDRRKDRDRQADRQTDRQTDHSESHWSLVRDGSLESKAAHLHRERKDRPSKQTAAIFLSHTLLIWLLPNGSVSW